ncbi:hypothetical protein E2C01_079455 [Portunus trituberculatus]|uniref:Uncharacterized protein n=1 Tax=Portunus trituberculatus TaxID=210409 RepID=A0A5B7ITE5_PORTR|nr:hypothetical protein [Portunus trituberculatus]
MRRRLSGSHTVVVNLTSSTSIRLKKCGTMTHRKRRGEEHRVTKRPPAARCLSNACGLTANIFF